MSFIRKRSRYVLGASLISVTLFFVFITYYVAYKPQPESQIVYVLPERDPSRVDNFTGDSPSTVAHVSPRAPQSTNSTTQKAPAVYSNNNDTEDTETLEDGSYEETTFLPQATNANSGRSMAPEQFQALQERDKRLVAWKRDFTEYLAKDRAYTDADVARGVLAIRTMKAFTGSVLGTLSPEKRQTLRDAIDENLSDNLSVEEVQEFWEEVPGNPTESPNQLLSNLRELLRPDEKSKKEWYELKRESDRLLADLNSQL